MRILVRSDGLRLDEKTEILYVICQDGTLKVGGWTMSSWQAAMEAYVGYGGVGGDRPLSVAWHIQGSAA